MNNLTYRMSRLLSMMPDVTKHTHHFVVNQETFNEGIYHPAFNCKSFNGFDITIDSKITDSNIRLKRISKL